MLIMTTKGINTTMVTSERISSYYSRLCLSKFWKSLFWDIHLTL